MADGPAQSGPLPPAESWWVLVKNAGDEFRVQRQDLPDRPTVSDLLQTALAVSNVGVPLPRLKLYKHENLGTPVVPFHRFGFWVL